jgi:hypothetical protein
MVRKYDFAPIQVCGAGVEKRSATSAAPRADPAYGCLSRLLPNEYVEHPKILRSPDSTGAE